MPALWRRSFQPTAGSARPLGPTGKRGPATRTGPPPPIAITRSRSGSLPHFPASRSRSPRPCSRLPPGPPTSARSTGRSSSPGQQPHWHPRTPTASAGDPAGPPRSVFIRRTNAQFERNELTPDFSRPEADGNRPDQACLVQADHVCSQAEISDLRAASSASRAGQTHAPGARCDVPSSRPRHAAPGRSGRPRPGRHTAASRRSRSHAAGFGRIDALYALS